MNERTEADSNNLSSFLNLRRPPLDALAFTSTRHAQVHVLHALCVPEPLVAGHASGVGSVHGQQLQHGQQEAGNLLAVVFGEVVLLVQHVWQRPVAQAVDIAQLALSVENLLRPFPG